MNGLRSASLALSVLGATTVSCGSNGVSGGAGHDGGSGPSADGSNARRDSSTSPRDGSSVGQPGECSGSVHTTGTLAAGLPAAPAVTLPSGFKIEVIASVLAAREMVALPNGDLLVATKGTDVWIVPNAEASGAPDAPVLFASVNDEPVQGVAFLPDTCTIAIGAQHGVYTAGYKDAQTSAQLGSPVASIRGGALVHTSTDTDTHISTSVTFAGGKLFASVGSSCNACVEVDPTRGTIQEMNPDGSGMTTKGARIRNAVAIATNPVTGTVWIGGAGQDDLALGHPLEYFDALTLHAGTADYGWPACEENHIAYIAGSDCSATVIPRIELPAYSTLIGAAFYPIGSKGAHAFPATYGGGVFITTHGSWHTNPDGTYFSAPRVAFVAMNGDTPKTPVDWTDPTKQWVDFVGGLQLADGKTRLGKPTGVAVGPEGSLFVSDDVNNVVYRVRPE